MKFIMLDFMANNMIWYEKEIHTKYITSDGLATTQNSIERTKLTLLTNSHSCKFNRAPCSRLCCTAVQAVFQTVDNAFLGRHVYKWLSYPNWNVCTANEWKQRISERKIGVRMFSSGCPYTITNHLIIPFVCTVRSNPHRNHNKINDVTRRFRLGFSVLLPWNNFLFEWNNK